eukprot:TCONS_00020441-protein
MSDRKKSQSGIIEGKDRRERIQKWFNHFQQLLGQEPVIDDENEIIQTVFDDLDFKTGEFTIDEYKKAKDRISLNKAPGPDNIPLEVIKKCNLEDILLNIAKRLLLNHDKPSQWSTSNIIPVPKKGDLSKTGNYRGISLNAISARLVNRMMLNRIQPKLDKNLRSNQNGFRPGRSTQSQILALRRLWIEGVKARHLPAVILFLDFRKAFDSIHRGKMLKVLAAYGIPNELINTIDILYKDTRAKVVSTDGETEYFNIVAGVLQGDTLAPYLFIIILDYVTVERANRTGSTSQQASIILCRFKISRISQKSVTMALKMPTFDRNSKFTG